LAPGYHWIAEAVCVPASVCPSRHQNPIASIWIVARQTLTFEAFGVPSIAI
jgi:hypothetical protein